MKPISVVVDDSNVPVLQEIIGKPVPFRDFEALAFMVALHNAQEHNTTIVTLMFDDKRGYQFPICLGTSCSLNLQDHLRYIHQDITSEEPSLGTDRPATEVIAMANLIASIEFPVH